MLVDDDGVVRSYFRGIFICLSLRMRLEIFASDVRYRLHLLSGGAM